MGTVFFIIIILSAYLVGAIPFGYLCARLVRGIDIREHGSKNIGATNVARVCGRGWGVLVFVLDFLKGAGPVVFWSAMSYAPPEAQRAVWAPLLAGVGAILGHIFPAYLGFRGGRGVATAAGVFVVLIPPAAGIALATWVLLAILFRYVSLASIGAAIVLVTAHVVLDAPSAMGDRLPVTVFAFAVVVLVIVRHAPNIRRLVAGTERKIGAKRPTKPTGTNGPSPSGAENHGASGPPKGT